LNYRLKRADTQEQIGETFVSSKRRRAGNRCAYTSSALGKSKCVGEPLPKEKGKQQHLAAQYGIRGIPTLILFKLRTENRPRRRGHGSAQFNGVGAKIRLRKYR